jgi:hypothetical protein
MGKVYAELDERLTNFISRQTLFFAATAPCLTSEGEGGHVSVSPKGYPDTFAVLGPRTVAYVDLTASGAETIAHLRQNGRINDQHRRPARTQRRPSLATRRSGIISTPNEHDLLGWAGCGSR